MQIIHTVEITDILHVIVTVHLSVSSQLRGLRAVFPYTGIVVVCMK